MSNKAVLILGMHRSGTSALAGALSSAGIYLGQNLTPGREDNPRGFFEHDDIWRVHQTLLEALGSDWQDIRSLPDGWQSGDAAAQAISDLRNIVENDFATSKLWGVKDPRMSRLFDLWPRLTQSIGADLRVILTIRHPMEVAQSLARRNGIKLAHSLALWLRHTLEAERTTRQCLRALQHYPDLLVDWRKAFERLDAALELGLPIRTPDQDAEIERFLDVGLRHHEDVANWASGGERGPVSDWCEKTYNAISVFPDEGMASALDEITAEFDEWEQRNDALNSQVAYHLTQNHRQKETILWLEGQRTQAIKQARQDISDREAERLIQSETIRSLEQECARLAESRREQAATIRSLREEYERLAELRREEAAGYEARHLRQSGKILSLEEEWARLAERRRNEVAEFETQRRVQSGTIRSLEEECGRLLETVRVETSRSFQKDADLLAVNRRIQQLEIEIQNRETALNAIYRSSSWRMTAPIRSIVTILRSPPALPKAAQTPNQAELTETRPVVWQRNITKLLSAAPPSHNAISAKETRRVSRGRSSHNRTQILIVTPDIHGPIRNGGIGTAFSALAIWCARWGYDVSILYALGDYTESEAVAHWQKYYSDLGVKLIALNSSALGEAPELQGSYCGQSAWKVDIWLRKHGQRFNLAIFPEWMGLAYYVLLSKGQGLAYHDLTIAVNAHSPENWALEGNRGLPDSTDALEREFMERESVRRADWVVSPSEYMFDWMRKHQWRLPDRRLVIQNLLSEPSYRDRQNFGAVEIRELVFFGRLEFRKGLKLFCDSIDLLPARQRERLGRVVFMGKASVVLGYDSTQYIQLRSAGWNIPVEICTNRNREQALGYLAKPGVLAIIASLSENSPYTVLECLHHRIRFLATSVGGIPELVCPDDRDRILFDPTPGSLRQKIADALERGSPAARMAQSQDQVRDNWLMWLRQAAPRSITNHPPAIDRSVTVQPLVSVCLVHYNRPALLAQALASLRAQTYQNFEVILVDDGSPSDAAQLFLDSLVPEFHHRHWKIIRQSNQYLGAARNRAAQAASGEYLLFMDDDNIAMPTELEVFTKAAFHSGADILTCFAYLFDDEALPNKTAKIWAPLGGAAGPGLYKNVFGDANALWKRDAFMQLGGYTTDHGVGHEDWELFAEAVLSGLHLEVVPEPLFLYRVHPGSMLRNGDPWANLARSARAYVRHDSSGMGLANAHAVCLLQSRTVSMNIGDPPVPLLDGKRKFTSIIFLAASDPKNVVRFLLAWKKKGLRNAARMSVMKSTYWAARTSRRPIL